jgi:hypothetical protein
VAILTISAGVNSLPASSGKSSYSSPVTSGAFWSAISASEPVSSPQSMMVTAFWGASFSWVGRFSILRTMDLPERTSPKTTCLPSRWGVGTVVTKNWEPLVPVLRSCQLCLRGWGWGWGEN